jgi:hypothetical protein
VNLKAKLYILKNHIFFLLGPSSFEHWFKSYLCITVGSLSFLQIAFGSSFVYLSLPLLCFLCRTPPPLSRPCALPLPPQRRSAPVHVSPQPLPRRFPASRWLLLASPCRLTAGPNCASPPPAVAATLAPPTAYQRTHASLPCLAAALPTPCWPALASSTSHFLCPSSAAVATHAADAPAPASTRSRLVLDPEHILESLAPSFLRCTHAFHSISLLRSPSSTRPPPPSLAIVDSRPHHPRTPIQCSQSSTMIRWCSSTPLILVSCIPAPFPAAPTSSFLRRRSAFCRPAGTEPLHPNQRHHQHHIIPLKRSHPSYTTLRRPSLQNAGRHRRR